MASDKTLTNLINEAQQIADEVADNAAWVQWFNNGLDDLADILYFDKLVYIEPTDNKYALPSDFLSPIYFKNGNGVLSQLRAEDFTGTGYKVIDGAVVLQGVDTSGNLEVYYYRRPNYLSTSTSTNPVDLPDLYTRALIYFACAQCMLKEDELEKYSIFMEQYSTARELIFKAAKAKRKGSIGAWKVIR